MSAAKVFPGFTYVRESRHMHNDIEVSRATIYRQANGCFHVERFYHMEAAMSLYNLGEDEAVEEMNEWVDGHTK